jgi:electron transfer flavoprotein beta subunit
MSGGTDVRRELAIAVCVKFVVDLEQLRVDPATGEPDLAHARYRINEFDRNALEEALRLKERQGGRIVGVSLVAEEPPRDVYLRAVAAGLDALYLVPHPRAASGDGLTTATLLAAALEEIGAVYEMCSWDIVLCGDAASDTYDSQIGPRLGEALGIVPITYVTGLEVRGGTVVARRMLEDCVHVVEAELPVLITVGSETNHPRLPHLMQILGAGQKPIEHLSLADLGQPDLAQAPPALELLGRTAPPTARKRIVLGGNDAGVLAHRLVRQLQAAGEVTL